ncbi:V-type ATP synthase subunit E [Mesoaciditoga sp.]
MNVEKKLNSLKEYIKSKSQIEAEKMIKDAEKRSKEIEEEYKNKANRAYESILNEAKNKVRNFERKEEAQSKAKASKLLLDAKNEIMKAAMRDLEESVYALSSTKDYPILFEKLLKEAIDSLDGKEITIQVRKEDKEMASKLLEKLGKESKKVLTLSDEFVPIKGGAIVFTNNKRIVIENTLESKLREMEETFLSHVFSELNING